MDKLIKENKITVAIVVILLITIGAYYYSKQSVKTTDILSLQTKCADQAAAFYKQGGYGDDSQVWTDSYTNHWNNKLSKCFIQITGLSLKDSGFSFIDIYDAFEGKHYATYMGHNSCDPVALVVYNDPKRCQLDSGNIWFDGNDTKNPADYHVGFQGAAIGPGIGDENTQKEFMNHVQQFMNE
jgi:hypothetical protein